MPIRRSNKSAKVPNVKLRPAAPAARKSKHLDAPLPTWVHEPGSDADMEQSFVDVCPRPFRGIVICATGIEDKTSLYKQAIELGAISIPDLTDKVTHLIAIEPGSAKYKCALENKIPIMHPSWIVECHEVWLRGDDVDLEESMEAHRLPIFSGVVLTLSGIDDVDRRTQINRLVREQGGTYVKNLERPVRVTHLLCASDCEEITDKMRYAQKFNQRGEASIQLLWEEWFWDSLEFGGRFDEDAYKVSNPPPKRKVLPDPASSPPRSSSPAAEHATSDAAPSASAALLDGAEEEEIARVKRVPAVTLQIWESLLGARGFEISQGKLVRSPSKSQKRAEEPLPDAFRAPTPEPSPTRSRAERRPLERQATQGAGEVRKSALGSFRRADSFQPMSARASGSRLPFVRGSTAAPSSQLAKASAVEEVEQAPVASSSKTVDGGADEAEAGPSVLAPQKLFSGVKFRTLGEARCPNVHNALEESGGALIVESEDADYIVVRLAESSALYFEEEDDALRDKYRTECWLERCMHEERICHPAEHVTFSPLKFKTPIPGADALNFSFSGLDQSEACWVRRLLRAFGGSVAPNFSRRSTHLLCPSGTGAKADKAREWDIPIVDMAWLEELAMSGSIPGAAPPVDAEPTPMPADVPKVDRKGKGKARADDPPMVDVTNDSRLDFVNRGEESGQSYSLPQHQVEEESFGEPFLLSMHEPAPETAPTQSGTPPHNTPPRSPGRLLVAATRGESIALESAQPQSVPQQQPASGPASSRDEPKEIIPSSATPSPVRRKSAPGTPAKLSREATKVLEESITSLLGKRPSSEEEGISGRPGRSKRARPPSRTKPKALRKAITVEDDFLPVVAPPRDRRAQAADDDSPYAVGEEDVSMLAEQDAVGESMRVTYEDPGQRDERAKLMQLLASQKKEPWEMDDGPVSAAGTSGRKKNSQKEPTRRSARVAGF